MSFTKELWINTDTRNLVEGFLQALSETDVTFTQGDTVPLRVYLLKQLTNNQGRPFQNIELSTETLKVALGRLDTKATGGTFTLDFDGDDTAAIPYNETATNIETALNGLASVVTAGGVTVTGDTSGPWTVTFTSNGARSAIIPDTSLVTPLSDMIVTTVTEGDGSTQEVQVLKLKESPVAVQTSFSIIAAPTIAVTEVIKGASGVNEIQKVKLDQVCQDGSFSLSYLSNSGIIEYGATATEMQTALEGIAGITAGDVAVQKISDLEYNITFQGTLAGTDVALLVADSSGLIGFSGFEADFEMGSYAVEQLLNGATENDEAYLEVELYNAGDKTTVLRTQAVIQNDLIDESVTAPPSNGTDWDALLDAKADKTTTITGTGNLNGGGDLSANRTLDMADMAQSTIKGRASGAGTGTPTDLSPAQVKTMLGYLENVVDDLTPQLGGDLDLNGNSLDFPTTANISDCLDEDDMTSDSATALATQQSIKAYVDGQSKVGAYRNIYIDAAAMVPRDTNGAEALTKEFATNDIMIDYLAFDSSTEEGVQFKMMMPDEWDRSTIKVKFFWDAAATASGTCVWGVSAGALSNDDAIDTALGTQITVTDTLLAVGDMHISPATAAVTVGGTPALEDMIIFQVVATTGGTVAVDQFLMGVAIQYKESTISPSIW